MSNDILGKLYKNSDGLRVNNSIGDSLRVEKTRKAMKSICESLSITSKEYQPENTVDVIVNYIRETEKLDRMLYSEISYYIFGLSEGDRGVIVANMANLLDYSLKDEFLKNMDSSVKSDCEKVIVKLYDHFELAIHQVENAKEIFEKSIEETKVDFSREIKKVERDYITILGIFTSIVLVFVGEFSFSSSVLTVMSDVNIYRLLLIIDILAMIVINIIALLVNMLLKINGIESEKFGIRWLNIFFGVVAIFVIIGWFLDIASISSYIRPLMPWK